jgi:hypothetical protein
MSTEYPEFPRSVQAAPVYASVDDLWLLTTYFNPAKFENKRRNYEAFAGKMASSGLRLVTIECAFGDGEFELPDSPNLLRVRASNVMWQKERLLNVAVSRLPTECRKIVWIDFDIYFENADWAVETSRMLENTPMVQPFAMGVFLPPGATSYGGEGRILQGFAATYTSRPDTLFEGIYLTHGHAGWAWAEPFYDDVQGRIGYVPGNILHIWHGRWRDRDYTNRHAKLREFGFDPQTDLRLGENGCWEWASDKPDLHAWAMSYFARRNEDGVPADGC